MFILTLPQHDAIEFHISLQGWSSRGGWRCVTKHMH